MPLTDFLGQPTEFMYVLTDVRLEQCINTRSDPWGGSLTRAQVRQLVEYQRKRRMFSAG